MKLLSLVEVILVNLVLTSVLVGITGDYGSRFAYWYTEGFASHTLRYPLFLITSAVKGSTSIPGLLTIDWQQVVVLVLVVTDVIYLSGLFREFRGGRPLEEKTVPE